jgi:Transposase C of IS166 homeodomain
MTLTPAQRALLIEATDWRRTTAAPASPQAAKPAVQLRTLEIEKLKFEIAWLRRVQFGHSSEWLIRQIEQLELRLEELEAGDAEAIAEDQPLPIHEGNRPKRKECRPGRCRSRQDPTEA